jgi:deoxyribonuclease-4
MAGTKAGVKKAEIFLGPAGTPTVTRGGTLEGIMDVAKLGLSALEVQYTYGVQMGMTLAKRCGEVARENNIRLSCHAPYYVNLCNPEKLAASMKRVLSAAGRMAAMGGGVVVFHPGFYGGLEPKEAFDRVRASCGKMVKSLPAGVVLGLETTGKRSQFGTLDEIVEVCKDVNKDAGLKFCVPVVDFAHVYARQGGKIDYGQVLKLLEPLRLGHVHSHFSNVEFTDRGERRHLVMDGSPPFEPLAREALKRKIGITIISESPVLEQDSLRMKRFFEKNGYEFL